MDNKLSININPIGIADALTRWRLVVPPNQRRYDWDEEVEQLFHDLTKAFEGNKPIYFLGMIVLIEGEKDSRSVADGQQRLATTSILLSAIRDYLLELNDKVGAAQYQSDFLIKYDPPSGEYQPRLKLNVEDDQFFFNTVLLAPEHRNADAAAKFKSNDRIRAAFTRAHEHVRNITAGRAPKDIPARLYDWIEFLRDKVLVAAITVPSHVSDSFRMFETLNARGMRASQIDVLKNFLFGLATANAAAQIHPRWISMLSIVESYGNDELLLTFIRHFWISKYGPTTKDELGESVENTINKPQQAVDLVAELDANASDYIALLNPKQHQRWKGFPSGTRQAINIISNDLAAVQIRPLLLAVTRRFEPKEAYKAFQMFVSWSVRFLIVGGGGGGKLDRYYGLRAQEVSQGKIKTAKELGASMADVVPPNKQFEEEFSRANVRNSALARYYLRALELHGQEDLPQLLINEDPDAVNLEHIIPVTPSDDWKLDAETAATFHKRLGNMVLLGAKDNVQIGNGPYSEKRKAYLKSPYTTTQYVGKEKTWGPEQVRDRQIKMAAIAPKVWPL